MRTMKQNGIFQIGSWRSQLENTSFFCHRQKRQNNGIMDMRPKKMEQIYV